jgi:hypothetical protein
MSKKPKGLSFDQKKEVLVQAMLTQASIYTMKELENLGRKNKVIPQAVPEVVEALISERAMCMDKIGTQNIYWAFPSQRKAVLLCTKDKLTADIETAKVRLQEAITKSEHAKKEINLSETDRTKIITETANLKRDIERLQQENVQLQKRDPRIHEAKLHELKQARSICDQMTDNICILRQFMLRKFAPVDANAIDEQFGIYPESMEYFVSDA